MNCWRAMFLCIAPYLFEEVFYGSVTISPIQPASDGNQNLQLFNGNDPWPVFQLHVRSSFWDDAVFSSTSKYLSNLWSLHEDFYGNQKKTRIPVTGPSFCRNHSVTSSYRESCRLLFGWHLLINFEDQTRTEKTATNQCLMVSGWRFASDLPQRKHHQAGETNHLNHWHFGSSLSQSNKSSWWVGASEKKYLLASLVTNTTLGCECAGES